MDGSTARLSLKGILDYIARSNKPLVAVFEAVTNALEAVLQRKALKDEAYVGSVIVRCYYNGLIPSESKLSCVEIEDDGIGFDDENFGRFETFLDSSKGFNNRGSGRVQMMHFSERIEVRSNFLSGGALKRRAFVCTPKKFISGSTVSDADLDDELGSVVQMKHLSMTSAASEFFTQLTLDDLKLALKNHFLLWLYLNSKKYHKSTPEIRIELYENDVISGVSNLTFEDIPDPITGDVSVPYMTVQLSGESGYQWQKSGRDEEEIKWAHFEINEHELPNNVIVLCSKGIAVAPLSFDYVRKRDSISGSRYITAFYGDVLDRPENVSHNVDRFLFKSKAEIESEIDNFGLPAIPDYEFILLDSIKDKVSEVLMCVYRGLVDQKEAQERKAREIASQVGIPEGMVQSAGISLTDDDEKISQKLFKAHAVVLSDRNTKIRGIFSTLQELNPLSPDYQDSLVSKSDELLALIPLQNKEELSRYIIRRQMVASVLRMVIDGIVKPVVSSAGRKDKEGLVHDLIFKRRGETGASSNDLWILNEEFVHFEGVSDLSVDKIKDKNGDRLLKSITEGDRIRYRIRTKRRPDIFLFMDEGQCVLIELKAPDEDLSEHIGQLESYCNLIANFCEKPITRFHCYLIGQELSPIDLAGRFRKNIIGDWVYRAPYKIMRYEEGRQEEEIAEANMEIIRLSSIHERAVRRNKSFAERLGLTGALDERSES